jgi:uncharacterized protein
MRPLLFRLTPGSDLKLGLLEQCALGQVKTGVILSAVGSLSVARLRIADGKTVIEKAGPFELTSLSGTISTSSLHCHLSLYDEAMNTLGGHLMEGCLIHTTMEISIMDLSDEFDTARQPDPRTGYDELVVSGRKLKPKKL